MSQPSTAASAAHETEPLEPRLAALDREDERWLSRLVTHHRFTLAKRVLAGAAIIFVLVILLFYFEPVIGAGTLGTGEAILEATLTVLPPIVTLVLGYYFGRD